MAHDAALDAGHALHPETTTGIDNRKLAIWTFIGSECMFFASLIATYLVYKGKSLSGPTPAEMLQIPLVTFGTALLLFSSLFVVLALNGAQRGNRRQLIIWLGMTLVCGAFFVGMQVYEFQHFVHEGLTLKTNLFGASFYLLTGFHGTHVTIGVLWLATVFVTALRGKLPPERAMNLEIAALYWHFVDVVWIVIFPVVYLMKD
ncbi:MAG TPA: cytochrome c oxidase subunit 3 [Gemmatimonadales bacterium]|nr:cytochrome c oxidase subunit 3 [Gemmatimonadales bacterium]